MCKIKLVVRISWIEIEFVKPYVPSVPSFIEVDDELQRLLEDDVELPDLSDTTYDTLAQRLPHQVDTAFDALPESHGHQVDRQLHDCVSEDHFGIQNEQSASSPSEPTQQQLNKNFARTINLIWAKQATTCPKSNSAPDVSARFFKTILPQCTGSEGRDGCIW